MRAVEELTQLPWLSVDGLSTGLDDLRPQLLELSRMPMALSKNLVGLLGSAGAASCAVTWALLRRTR